MAELRSRSLAAEQYRASSDGHGSEATRVADSIPRARGHGPCPVLQEAQMPGCVPQRTGLTAPPG